LEEHIAMRIFRGRCDRIGACAFAIGTAVLMAATVAPRNGAAQETVLYSFKASSDAGAPQGGVITRSCALHSLCNPQHKPGHLYGTTYYGGSQRVGAVFDLTHTSQGQWSETVLYSFCSKANCTDGARPLAPPIIHESLRLYGTAAFGGAHGEGVVYELIGDANTGRWTEKVLYSFCATGGPNCTDGSQPVSGLILDGSGNFYGTTQLGGTNGGGTVFELVKNAGMTPTWTEEVLYSFCAAGRNSCTDGASPDADLIMDSFGNLYSTTYMGGAYGHGTVFELTPDANKTEWAETVLYSFCALGGCADGATPSDTPVSMDGSGNLYSTTNDGGAHGGGTVFELTPNADKTNWTETVLYSFCALSGCVDGIDPNSGVIMDRFGNLYGTTYIGGAHGEGRGPVGGTVFKLSPNANQTEWTESVLHSFCALPGCSDGAGPKAALVMHCAPGINGVYPCKGNLYSTTWFGGAHGGGTVFEVAN
jgi:uncharacterized repeat protein (TIGR03803 family)